MNKNFISFFLLLNVFRLNKTTFFFKSNDGDWATGTVQFKDGQSTAEVKIPLEDVPTTDEKFRSSFYIYVVDQKRKKRMTTVKCDFIDDRS